ncbi:hypothetical protein ACJJTC_006539 [Scirpophaga incertulas]
MKRSARILKLANQRQEEKENQPETLHEELSDLKSSSISDLSSTCSNYTPPRHETSSDDSFRNVFGTSNNLTPLECVSNFDSSVKETINLNYSEISYISGSPYSSVFVERKFLQPYKADEFVPNQAIPLDVNNSLSNVSFKPPNNINLSEVSCKSSSSCDIIVSREFPQPYNESEPNEEIIYDINSESQIEDNSNDSTTSIQRQKPKSSKVRDKDYCFYCESFVLNFARHLLRHHIYETEVQKIVSKPKKSLDRKQLIAALRKKGNYLVNSKEVTKPMRKFKFTDYLPCTECLGFYSKKLLWKHKKKCSGKSGSKNIQSEAQNLLIRHLKIDEKLKESVFPRMRADKISLIAKKDNLICAFGSQYLKTHREKHFVNVVSRKMRELAKLLLELKKIDPSINDFFSALRPIHYDIIVQATKILGNYDIEKDRYGTPTFAMNLSTTLKQCCNIAIIRALKKQGPYMEVDTGKIEADLKTLIQLIESNWKYDVSTQAATDLNKKKVLLLNRRRPGELQRLTVHDYLESDNNDNNKYEEFDRALTASERILVKKFKRVVIRGKRGRGVPVLFNKEVQDDIKLLLSIRHIFFDTTPNQFLFGNPGYNNTIYGYKVLEKHAKLSGAKQPKAISSTRLRKHLATLSQVFSMSENDMEQLATFMGHTNEVHKKSYRLPDDVYQTAKISKLLILMEDGKADTYKGKSLEEIDLDLNEELIEEPVDNNEIIDYDPEPEPTLDANSDYIQTYCNLNDLSHAGSSCMQNDSQQLINEPVSQLGNGNKLRKGKKRTLVPWTKEQRDVVTKYFKCHIKNHQPPKRNECEKLKEQHVDLLKNKDWLKIKVFVQNIYSKAKK